MNPLCPIRSLQKGFEKNLIIQKRAEAQEVGHILEIEMC